MNKIFLIGNLSKDVELRNTNSGKVVASVSMATNKRTKDQNGNVQNIAQFHNLVIWGNAGETFAKYLSKGSKIAVVGELVYDKFKDKNGIDRTIAKVIVNEFEFLGGGKKQERAETNENLPEGFDNGGDDVDEIRIEDIPF